MLCRSDTITPTLKVRRCTRLRATALARYPNASAAAITATRLAALTEGSSRMTRETTDFDRPALRATSMIVAGREGSEILPAALLAGLDICGSRIILAGTFPWERSHLRGKGWLNVRVTEVTCT